MRAGEIRRGNAIKFRGGLWIVLDTRVAYVGKRGAYAQVKMQSLSDHHIETQRFSTSDDVEKAFLESRTLTYLYCDGAAYVFMDPDTGDQISVGEDRLKDALPYLAYNAEVDMKFCEGEPVQLELPSSVALEVTETDPAVRGDTATAVTKPATVETGTVVKVPGHIQQGEKIRVDTRTGEFLGRA